MRPHKTVPTRSWAAWRTRRNVAVTEPGLRRSLVLSGDEPVREVARLVVRELLRGRLHEVARRAGERPADLAIERELRASHRIDDDAGGIGRIPDFELQFHIERDTAEARAFHADIGPFAIGEPRHVVARADMDVLGRKRNVELARHGLGLGDLL